MELNWTPFDSEPGRKVAALKALFKQGLRKQLDPDYLCALAVDIGRCAPLGSDDLVVLTHELIGCGDPTVSVWSVHAQALRLAGSIDAAIDAAKQGLELAPACGELLLLMGKLYSEKHQAGDAEELFRQAFQINPKGSVIALCENLISQGKLDEASRLHKSAISQFGHTTASRAMSCVISRLQKDWDQLDYWQNRGAIIQCSPEEHFGATRITELNQEISQCLLSHPSLVFEPQSTATSRGRQGFIGDLLPATLSDSVIKLIQMQVAQSIDKFPDHMIEGFQAKQASITCWAVILDKGGFQHPHIHPAGLLSGVYYVDIPKPKADSSGGGSIVFGKPPCTLVKDGSDAFAIIQPSSGVMVLFPSYIYHSTIPHSSEEPRICLSFDVCLS